MKNQKKKSFPLRVFLCLLAVLLAVYVAFGVYVNDYYHADPAAEDALVSDDVVSVTEQNGNWVFAPESPTARLIFYPGGKVENTAEEQQTFQSFLIGQGSVLGVHNLVSVDHDIVDASAVHVRDE